MADDEPAGPSPETPEVDPREFLRALMRLSPEDAAKARANSPARRKRKPQEGPFHDYGDGEPDGGDR